MSIEQRRYFRIGVVVDIELTVPGKAPQVVKTRNISDGGLFLILDDIELPAMNTEVQVKVNSTLGDGEEAPINRARVVRHEPEGIGLEFIE